MGRKWSRWLVVAAAGVSSAIVAFSAVLAVNPSGFVATHQDCDWRGTSDINYNEGIAYTDRAESGCIDLCYLYAQWINGGGTYYTYTGIYQTCIHWKVYDNVNQTELYGLHAVTEGGHVSNTRSTDAYCGGAPC